MTLEDLPLPRKPNHVWALSHEESPKNNILFTFKGMSVALLVLWYFHLTANVSFGCYLQ